MRHISLFVLAAVLPACLGNQSGNIGATKVGDTSNPATRGSPIAELRQACGAVGNMIDSADVIHREPYLQSLTSSSVAIGWISITPDGQRIDVTAPDGQLIATAAGVTEPTVVRSAGEKQVWAHVEGLAPDTSYCYALADGTGALSERIGFRTPPAADSTRPIRFLALGDSGGGGSDQYALLEQMFEFPYDFIIHTGDLAYDSGTITQFETTVFGVYAELFRHLAFFPASGNHEYETMQGAPFRDVFSLPADNGEKWYSYDWGPIHFVALDTEADYGTQAAWLDRDLAATSLPWKIVYLHRPPYSSGGHGSDTSLRSKLAPVVQKHGVQLVLAGHDHNYERTSPQSGIVYVVTGGGGRGTRPVSSSSFTEFSEAVIHFVTVEVGVDELALHAIDATGKEFDSVVIPRVR